MIELNMKFSKSGLFIKKPLRMCLSHGSITYIVEKLLLKTPSISFYCKCHYAGVLRKVSFMKFRVEKYDFDEEIPFNLPDSVDSV